MGFKVSIIYNRPQMGHYHALGEGLAEIGALHGAMAIRDVLRKVGYQVSLFSLNSPVEKAKVRLKLIKANLIFNLSEGFDSDPQSEAAIAFALGEMGIPFTGCPGVAIALAQDKAQATTFLSNAGVPSPSYQVLSPADVSLFHLKFPCIVKPVTEHGSHGVRAESVVSDLVSLIRQVERVSRHYNGRALVEEYIDGREFNVTVMGNKDLIVLPVSEIIYDLPPDVPKILTYAAKWEEESVYFKGTKAVCPAVINEADRVRIEEMVKKIYRLAGCRGYARVDMRQDKEGNFKVIDINPNPDISPEAGASLQAKTAGMTYSMFIERIVRLAFEERYPCS